MNLHHIADFQYPQTNLPLRLFQDRQTMEGYILSCELGFLMGYGSMAFVRRLSNCREFTHFVLLKGDELKKFKHYLGSVGIHAYRRSNRLLLINETGVALLMARSGKEQVMRGGQWLVGEVFATLREPSLKFSLKSIYLDSIMPVYSFQGKFAVSCLFLFTLLRKPAMDYIARAVHGFIENIHLYRSKSSELFFSECGLYRYLGDGNNIIQKAFEKEIWPAFRLGRAANVQDITEQTIDYSHREYTDLVQEQKPKIERRIITGTEKYLIYKIQNLEKNLLRVEKDVERKLDKQNLAFTARLAGLKDIFQQKMHP